ncbi:MAG: hypothetical protein IT378_00835 [Sandaracinaceae bacterium]|nr:hypothetical protein [Sandaracinaceae bacterium]
MSIVSQRQDVGTEADFSRVLEFVATLADHCREQFPRHCPACDRRYASFEQYLTDMVPIGIPIEYDPAPDDPHGIVDFANCICGTTLSIQWEGPPSPQRVALREAIEREAARTSGGAITVLLRLRDAIYRTVLGAERHPQEPENE